MSNQDNVQAMLASVDAVVTDKHFVYVSGKHGPAYINKDAIYPHTKITSRLCRAIAEHFAAAGINIVIAPAVGAVILSQWVAHHLSDLTKREVLGVYADKDGDDFVIKRGYEKLISGKRVLVVEDLLTTGLTASKVVEAVRRLHGLVYGVACIANRGGVTHAQVGDAPILMSLLDVPMEMYDEADCPLCKQGVPINTSLGHGAAFLARKRQRV